MPELKKIRLQLRNLGASPAVLNKAEIRYLPNIMLKNETIKEFITGVYVGGYGMLIATDKRLLFVDKKLFDMLVDDIPYSMIAAVEFDVGMFWGKVQVYTRAKNFKFGRVRRQRTMQFARYVEARMFEAQSKMQYDHPTQQINPPSKNKG